MISVRALLQPAALVLALSSPAFGASPASLHAAPHSALAAGAQAEAQASQQAGVLPAAATEKLLPNAILFKGQLAPVQARNSGAIRYPDHTLTVISLVDASGYSSAVRERFQFFVYTEKSLELAPGKILPPGFYGAGFLADNTMAVMDVSGHDLMVVPTTVDSTLSRPRPLQLLSGTGGGDARLYLGRSYIVLHPAP